MTDKLMAAYAASTETERSAFMAVMVKNTTSNETYQGLKQFDAEKKAEADKQALYAKGEADRLASAAKFQRLYPNT